MSRPRNAVERVEQTLKEYDESRAATAQRYVAVLATDLREVLRLAKLAPKPLSESDTRDLMRALNVAPLPPKRGRKGRR